MRQRQSGTPQPPRRPPRAGASATHRSHHRSRTPQMPRRPHHRPPTPHPRRRHRQSPVPAAGRRLAACQAGTRHRRPSQRTAHAARRPSPRPPPPEASPTPRRRRSRRHRRRPTAPATVTLSQEEAPVFQPAAARSCPPCRRCPCRRCRRHGTGGAAHRPGATAAQSVCQPTGVLVQCRASKVRPGRASRGFDMSPPTSGSRDDSTSGLCQRGQAERRLDGCALRRWIDARKYYPEGAIQSLQQGGGDDQCA